MRCPKCRRYLAFDAMEHDCGWKLASREVSSRLDPQARERVHGMLRDLLKTLKGRRVEDGVLREVTVGHGNRCCCEVCFPKRVGR